MMQNICNPLDSLLWCAFHIFQRKMQGLKGCLQLLQILLQRMERMGRAQESWENGARSEYIVMVMKPCDKSVSSLQKVGKMRQSAFCLGNICHDVLLLEWKKEKPPSIPINDVLKNERKRERVAASKEAEKRAITPILSWILIFIRSIFISTTRWF